MNERMTRAEYLPIEKLHAFENHPFQVRDDDQMEQLVWSILSKGVMTPIMRTTVSLNKEDLALVKQIQDEIEEYITLILAKKVLKQRLGESSDVRLVQVLFDLAKDLIVHDNSKEDTDGID